jgi:hypothetical protein
MLLKHEGFRRLCRARDLLRELHEPSPSDMRGEFARLTAKGVAFRRDPAQAGPVTLAVFADTCGNLIQLYQPA